MTVHFSPLRQVLAACLGALLLLGGAGCACEKEETKTSASDGPPPPLKERAAPSDLGVQIYPAVGAVQAWPTVVVLSSVDAYCSAVKQEFVGRAHVLCSSQEAAKVEAHLKKALAFLKETYPRHVAPAPVLLVADPSRARLAFRLMLKEPSFFAHSYLAGLPEKVLTATTLAALHDQGARTLLLDLDESKRMKLLSNVASRRGLHLQALGADKDGLSRALTHLMKADERLSPKPGPKPASP